ncbi:MAG: Xaa-Pro peptidase family protein [Candidatus Nanopelagicales bacterium]|nr:Xaa-Pro peptidase family protein [Candidatus Nanopelagicales bacterium]
MDFDFVGRLARVAAAAREQGRDAVLLTPGSDLRYLSGYQLEQMERLTCLAVRAVGDPFLVVPDLEESAARAALTGELDIEVIPFGETDDPHSIVASHLGQASAVALDNQMWAEKVLRFREAMPGTQQVLAGSIMGPLRAAKSEAEIAALMEAGAAIDSVHARAAGFLRPGRTEREVGADIAAAIIDAGHVQVDFVIVGSGPNGASPHHEVSDRAIGRHEPVVVDIGGMMRSGYRSDSTRTYCIGDPPAEFLDYYEVLKHAQATAVAAVGPGMTCESLDAVARDLISEAGFGENFIHRTGHGIGLDTHEDPYIVAGNTHRLEQGNAFSIEPGIYLAGRHGARIEDIVVCGTERAILVNNIPRDLVVID